MSLLAVGSTVRSWPGGTGDHKLGSNYAPTFLPQRMAARKGAWDQILWLLGEKVTEAGAMNFFLVVKRDDGSQGEISIHSLTPSRKPYSTHWVFHPLTPLVHRSRRDHTPTGRDDSPRSHTGFLPCASPRTCIFCFGTFKPPPHTAPARIRAPSLDS